VTIPPLFLACAPEPTAITNPSICTDHEAMHGHVHAVTGDPTRSHLERVTGANHLNIDGLLNLVPLHRFLDRVIGE
jgi:hypothetical protein